MHLFCLLLNTGPHTHTHAQTGKGTLSAHWGIGQGCSTFFGEMSYPLSSTTNSSFSFFFFFLQKVSTHIHFSFHVVFGADGENKIYFFVQEISKTELAVYVSADSSELNLEGRGEEFHIYKTVHLLCLYGTTSTLILISTLSAVFTQPVRSHTIFFTTTWKVQNDSLRELQILMLQARFFFFLARWNQAHF